MADSPVVLWQNPGEEDRGRGQVLLENKRAVHVCELKAARKRDFY